jgi:aspartate kinase
MPAGHRPRANMNSAPATCVLRFGGSSVDTPLRMRHATERVRQHRRAGVGVVAVIGASAYGASRIFACRRRLAELPDPRVERELDRALAGAEQVTAALLAATVSGADVGAARPRPGPSAPASVPRPPRQC